MSERIGYHKVLEGWWLCAYCDVEFSGPGAQDRGAEHYHAVHEKAINRMAALRAVHGAPPPAQPPREPEPETASQRCGKISTAMWRFIHRLRKAALLDNEEGLGVVADEMIDYACELADPVDGLRPSGQRETEAEKELADYRGSFCEDHAESVPCHTCPVCETHAMALQLRDTNAALSALRSASPQPAKEGEVSLRPEVVAFARLMESQLRRHDGRKGIRGWKHDRPGDLLRHAEEEWREFVAEVESESARMGNPERLAKEAADLANMIMMIADVSDALRSPTPPERTEETERRVERDRSGFHARRGVASNMEELKVGVVAGYMRLLADYPVWHTGQPGTPPEPSWLMRASELLSEYADSKATP